MRAAQITHGMTDTPEWTAWNSMVQRCTCKTHAAWGDYGGRGITVCKRWLKFENFFKDMGPRPAGTTLDRKNNARGYSPANCRWATWEEQQYSVVKARHAKGAVGMELFAASPRKPYGRRLIIDGVPMTITQWAKHLGVTYKEAWQRARNF
jgi:hypothetical protein